MALEQWEIDLRKQLEERINQPKPASDNTWEDKLVQDIQGVPPKKANDKPKNNGGSTVVMLVLLVVLGIATLFAYDMKNGGAIQNWIMSKFSHNDNTEEIVRPPHNSGGRRDYDAEIAALRSDLQRIDADTKAKVDKLATKVEWNNQRLTLIGVMLNENFMIMRNNADKGHLIFFNRDWTLDQMPHYLELSDGDRAYLQKYVKPAQ